MEVTRYIFQSPYSSQVQIGKPDTSSAGAKENENKNPVDTVTKLDETTKRESTITANADKLLDTYA